MCRAPRSARGELPPVFLGCFLWRLKHTHMCLTLQIPRRVLVASCFPNSRPSISKFLWALCSSALPSVLSLRLCCPCCPHVTASIQTLACSRFPEVSSGEVSRTSECSVRSNTDKSSLTRSHQFLGSRLCRNCCPILLLLVVGRWAVF